MRANRETEWPLALNGGEREVHAYRVHIWTTLREEQIQDGVNPWTEHSKQPL